MAKERRDSKNRLLLKGEYQKEDGRYMYRYVDINGKPRFVYSWTLTKTDRTPKGKPIGKCLRDLEYEIANDVHDKIDSYAAANCTLNEYFDKYMEQKIHLKPTTRSNYKFKYDLAVRNTIGNRKIADIKYSDILKFYNDLMLREGKSFALVMNIDVLLKPTFRLAIRDDCIRKNPTDGVISDLKKEIGKSTSKKFALSEDEQNRFLEYVKNHKRYCRWYPMMMFLLWTGCRIGEACGLTWSDCDLKNNVIHINRTFSYSPDEESGEYKEMILSPKTNAGVREIPMFECVKEILQKERANQLRNGFCQSNIDGVSGFVFMNWHKKVQRPTNVNKALERIIESYNSDDFELAKKEGRAPTPLPELSPHILRHTFCTRLCENDINLKIIQEIMGHAQISITMDIYNNVTSEFRKKSYEGIEKKLIYG